MLRSSRRFGGIVVNLAVVGLLVGVVVWAGPFGDPAGPGNGRGGPKADEGGAEEAAEQQEESEKRNAAFEKARREGKSGQTRPAAAAAAPGWVGEFPMDTTWDDWEPAIAADPNGALGLCPRRPATAPRSRAPATARRPWIALEISTDNGATWSAGKPLCACKGSGQFDPIIEVVPSTGHVYAAVHERLQRRLHEVDQPRPDLVGAGHDVGQRQLERQAGHRDERRRQGRLRLVQRSDRRRSVGRPVARLRGDVDPDEARRWLPLLLRVRRRRRRRRDGLLRRVEHPLRRRRQQGHDAGWRDRPPRLHLARPRRHLGEPGRGIRPAGRSLRRGGLHARFLPRPSRSCRSTATATSSSSTTEPRRRAASRRSRPGGRRTGA